MQKILLASFAIIIIQAVAFTQSSKRPPTPSVHISTAFNYYPSVKPYRFTSNYIAYHNDLILNFITSNSGTFVIEEGDSLDIERVLTSHLPSQTVGLGASIQVKDHNMVFHEISLTIFSLTKSQHTISYAVPDSMGYSSFRFLGYEQKAAAIGVRYELGKYFGKSKDAKLRFGFSGGVETTFYHYNRIPYESTQFPLEANILTLDLSLMPIVSVALSKKVTLDFKLVSNILMADFGTMQENNPSFTKKQIAAGGERNYKSPDMTWAFNVMLRYMAKEPKRQ